MPYRRRSYRKRRFSRRGGYRKLSKRISAVYRAVRPELKHVDNFNSSAVSTSATINYITNIAQGDDDNSRDGSEIKVRGFVVKWGCFAGDATNVCRIMIIRDANSLGVVPSESEIFETTANPYSPINSNYQKRFHVLFDKVVGVALAGKDAITGNTYVTVRNRMVTEYINTTASQNGAGVNAYYLVRISDSGAATHPTISVYTRTIYTE